ncbi:uncharacterized protein BCN122_II2886 [Burkholderia cenocepacia]|nr:uncharacterized protein BCN122_II2886 [Burkholderia cenocepacia]
MKARPMWRQSAARRRKEPALRKWEWPGGPQWRRSSRHSSHRGAMVGLAVCVTNDDRTAERTHLQERAIPAHKNARDSCPTCWNPVRLLLRDEAPQHCHDINHVNPSLCGELESERMRAAEPPLAHCEVGVPVHLYPASMRHVCPGQTSMRMRELHCTSARALSCRNQSCLPFSRAKRVLDQHRHRHRADSARYGCQPARALTHAVEVHVANNAAIRQSVDTHVDHHGAAFHHWPGYQTRLTGRDDEDVCENRELGKVARTGMTDAHRGLFLQQHQRHRLAHDIAGANDDSVFPRDLNARRFQQQLNAIRRAWRKHRLAQHKRTHVIEMETINILVDIDRFDDPPHVDVGRQWQLNQNAVNALIGVQPMNQLEHIPLCRRRWQHVALAANPTLLAGAQLVTYVHCRGWVIADQHHSEPWLMPGLAKSRGAFAHGRAQPVRQCKSINQLRRHTIFLCSLQFLYVGRSGHDNYTLLAVAKTAF